MIFFWIYLSRYYRYIKTVTASSGLHISVACFYTILDQIAPIESLSWVCHFYFIDIGVLLLSLIHFEIDKNIEKDVEIQGILFFYKFLFLDLDCTKIVIGLSLGHATRFLWVSSKLVANFLSKPGNKKTTNGCRWKHHLLTWGKSRTVSFCSNLQSVFNLWSINV